MGEWLIGCFVDWPVGWLIVWLFLTCFEMLGGVARWLGELLSYCLACWLLGWLADWLIGCLVAWFVG